jgi:hypothetical protein
MSEPLRIGKYHLSSVIVPEGEKPPFHDEPHIYIQHESGEGMSVREDILGAVIDNFYKEHF